MFSSENGMFGMVAHHISCLPLQKDLEGVNIRAAGVCNLQMGCAYTVRMSAAGDLVPLKQSMNM